MKHFLLLLATSIIGLSACKKTETCAEPNYGCITEKTQEFAKNSSCKTGPRTTGASVKEYSFQNRLVYVFDPGNCGADEASDVLDGSCQSIGFLGGLAGNTELNGEPFAKAELKRTIWEQ